MTGELKVTRVKKKDVLEKKVSEVKEKEAREECERKLRNSLFEGIDNSA